MMNPDEHLPADSRTLLACFLAFHIALFATVIYLTLGDTSLVLSWTKTHWTSMLALLTAMVLTLIAGNLAKSKVKAVLVFWEWSEPWPISRVFTRYLPKAPQMEPANPNSRADHLPAEPEAQKALWQQVYHRHKTEPAVSEAGKQFMLAQELTWLSFVILIFFGIGSLLPGKLSQPAWVYPACLFIQYIAAATVARTQGIRFFSDVLAVAETHKIIGRSRDHTDLAPG